MTKFHDYTQLRERAERLSKRLMDRARQECQAAGLGHDIGCALHNCMVSREYGKPWRGVDYTHARRAVWFQKRSGEGFRILERLQARGRVAVGGHIFVPGRGPVAVETY